MSGTNRKSTMTGISKEAKARLKQIAKERHAPMTVALNQIIFDIPVEHPEEIEPVVYKQSKGE